MSQEPEVKPGTEQQSPRPVQKNRTGPGQCPHAAPVDKRSYEKWLHAHGLSNRLAVRLAVAWPTTQGEVEAEQAEKEEAEAIEVMARLTRMLKEV